MSDLSFKKYKRNSFKIVNRRIFLDDEFIGTLIKEFNGFHGNEILEYKNTRRRNKNNIF